MSNKTIFNFFKKYTQTGDLDFLEILKHSIWAFIMLGLAAGAQFFFDLLLARNFGAEGTGVFYLAFSVLATVALIGRLGLNRAVIKYIPGYVSESDWPRISGIKKTAFRLSLLLSIPLAIIVFISAPLIAADIFNHPQLTSYLRLFALGIPPLSLIYVQAGVLRGLKSIKESMLVERVGLYALGIIFLLVLGYFLQFDGVMIGFVTAIYMTATLGSLLIRKSIPKVSNHILFNKKTLLLVAAPLLFVEFSNQMTGQLNVMVLGALSSAGDVGIFNIALKVSMLIGILLTGINAIATTKIAELHSKKDYIKLELTASKTAGLALLCGSPFMILFFVFPEIILGLFGAEFTEGATALRVLVLAQLVNLGVGAVTHLLAMTGHERVLATTIVGSVFILNITLSFLLIPAYGIVGASAAVASSIAVKNILLLYLAKKYLGFWSLPFKAMKVWIKSI